jgi:alkanesulfonate monooxygenase SsuD/methylene tetrahydromethanopterin reductase-like flavin-dependent oxidoreductase (luciferase family)
MRPTASYAESLDRFREILDIVERTWSEASFSYEGKYYRFRNVAVVPKPYEKPPPPIRIAASTPDTFPAIGRRGAPIFASVRHTSWSALAEQNRSYHEARREAGHPGKGQIYVPAPTYLAETNDGVLAEPRASIMHFYQEQANLLEGAAPGWSTRRPRLGGCGGSSSSAVLITRRPSHQYLGRQPRRYCRKITDLAGRNRPERDAR